VDEVVAEIDDDYTQVAARTAEQGQHSSSSPSAAVYANPESDKSTPSLAPVQIPFAPVHIHVFVDQSRGTSTLGTRIKVVAYRIRWFKKILQIGSSVFCQEQSDPSKRDSTDLTELETTARARLAKSAVCVKLTDDLIETIRCNHYVGPSIIEQILPLISYSKSDGIHLLQTKVRRANHVVEVKVIKVVKLPVANKGFMSGEVDKHLNAMVDQINDNGLLITTKLRQAKRDAEKARQAALKVELEHQAALAELRNFKKMMDEYGSY